MAATDSRPTRELLLDTIRANPGIDRATLIATTGLPSGAIDPARIRLWAAGLIEPDSDAGWKQALANRVKGVGWRVVDDTERQREVKALAASRKRRNARPSAERQAQDIVEALRDPTVNRLVQEMTKDGSGSRRAQRRTEAALRAEHMARKRAAKQAERERTANADFKRMLAHLWDARGTVGAIDKHLIEERARVAHGVPRRISDDDWARALLDIRTIITSFGTMWQNVRDLGDEDEPCPACGAAPVAESRELGAFALDDDIVESDAEEILGDEAVEG